MNKSLVETVQKSNCVDLVKLVKFQVGLLELNRVQLVDLSESFRNSYCTQHAPDKSTAHSAMSTTHSTMSTTQFVSENVLFGPSVGPLYLQ